MFKDSALKAWKIIGFVFYFYLAGCESVTSPIASSSIHSIDSFSAFDLENIGGQEILVLFDVDETLIQPEDTYFINEHSSDGQTFRAELLKKHSVLLSDKTLQTTLLLQAKRPLIDTTIIQKINRLKQNGAIVFAITAMNTGIHGHIKKLESWRYTHLKSLGFEGSWPHRIFNIPGFKRHPVFYRGILATDLEDKGRVLGAALDHLNYHPKEVIAFDDTLAFLISLKNECKKRSISFKGVHYLGARKVPWDQTLITFQASYLLTNKQWLNDQEAKKQMARQLTHP